MRSEITKNRTEVILNLLKEAKDWKSGEEISSLLGISRAAVAKHVATLRLVGHPIESASRRGYRLLFPYQEINLAEVQSHLSTTVFGKGDWHILPKSVSTNSEAITLALNGATDGSVVIAEQQTTGRGTKGKKWFSAPRSLQFSVILRPDFFPELYIETSKSVSTQGISAGTIAIVEAIKKVTGFSAYIKRPNDVFLGGKKVAGFLEEVGFRGSEVDWIVLGIGCNVNTLEEEFPEYLRGTATSMYAFSGIPISRNVLLASILNELEHWYTKLITGQLNLKKELENRM